MRWWPWRRRPQVGKASEESAHAVTEANRALKDARVMREIAGERHQKATEVAAQLEETNRRNHFGAAVARSMRKA